MKLKKPEAVTILVTAVFVVFTLGFLAGRGTSRVVTVEPQRTVTADAAQPGKDKALSTPSTGVAINEDGGRIDISTASLAELSDLPGIGEKLAERIIEYREKNGDFAAPEDIMNVPGIGEGKFAAIKDYIKTS